MVKLVSILGNITQLSQNTSEKSSAILTSTAKSKTTVDEVENYVRELTNSASELDNVFNVARRISAEVVSYVQRLQNQIFRQNNSIQEASSAIHLISNSINDVSKQNKSMLSTVQKLHRSAKSGDENISAALSVINKTSSSAQIILDLLAVINDIAERTNMLAMNAAIEAAHAGVSGKGFAVVATEIRKLAESTAANSKSIEQSLQAVIQDIKNSRDAAISTAEVFESIYANVEMVSERMEEERKAVQQLTMDIFHVDKSLRQIVTTTKEVETISKEITSLNQKVDQTLSNITQVSTQTRSNTQKMSLLFYEMAKNFGNINKITRDFDDSVKKTVEELHKIVNL
jgi:methyl-accepting chemotaxis protein